MLIVLRPKRCDEKSTFINLVPVFHEVERQPHQLLNAPLVEMLPDGESDRVGTRHLNPFTVNARFQQPEQVGERWCEAEEALLLCQFGGEWVESSGVVEQGFGLFSHWTLPAFSK